MPKVEKGAETPEIEITPEMIEAGARAVEAELWDRDLGPSLATMVADCVLRAALSLSAKKNSGEDS